MNAMLDRLERSSAQQRAFVSDASHELRSPIATIRRRSRSRCSTTSRPTGRRSARDVLAEDERLAGVVSDLLELARLDENGDALTDAPEVDLDDVVLDEVSRCTAPRWRRARCRPAGSAAGATSSRAPFATCSTTPRTTPGPASTSRCRPHADGVVLVVDDDGPGIPEADRERVFDRFTRLDEGRDRDGGGAGLGLAMVRAIVERHRGTVTVDSGALGGARFVVRLPAGETVPRDDGAT